MSDQLREATTGGGPADASATPLAQGISAFGRVGVALLLVPIALTCADILWRRIIGGAFIDTFDITKLCLVAVAAWSIPYGFIHGNHVTVDLLVDRLPARTQGLLDAVIHVICAALFVGLGWLAWKGLFLHYGYHDTTQNLGIPVIYYWGIFLIGLALSVVASLWRALQAWRRVRNPVEAPA